MLYLLTGRNIDGESVFSEDKVQDVLKRVTHRELRVLLAQMLKRDPEKRLSMDEVVRQLVRMYGGKPR